MKTSSIGFLSRDAITTVHALLWQPDKAAVAPRGIVQIAHGMSEYAQRYEPFAQYLVSQGFVVCANDHVGHGKSVSDESDWGHIPMHGGKDVLVEDVHELRRLVAGRFSSATPYVLFGHSMGSFIVRSYLATHGEGLAAAILCGTGQQPVALSKAGNALAHLLGALRGERFRSALLRSMAEGAFAKQIPHARTEVDWIAADDSVVDAYRADPACGQPFSAGGYAALTALTAEVVGKASAKAVASDLPLLFIAGKGDPVGEFGEGVKRAVAQYRDAGVATVDLKLYEGMRHEILNESDRQRVYLDVVDWLAAQGI